MSALIHDMRYAFQTCARKPGFMAVIVVTLALGIGANTAIFSVINAVVLRPLPYDNAGDLVMVWETNQEKDRDQSLVSYPNFEDWRLQNSVFEDIGIFTTGSRTLTGLDVPMRVRGAQVSSGFFSTLRLSAAVGRTFSAEEDRIGAPQVVVLSDGFWRDKFGADPDLVGKALTLDGTEFTVIGVLPPDFDFPIRIAGAELWTPVGLMERFIESRGGHGFRSIARLKPGVTLPQAQAEMGTIASRLELQYPDSNAGYGVNIVPLHKQVVGDVRPALLILLGAVGLVLLIACANVANLLLARSEGRRQELAVRAALGANRTRLMRQLLTESMLLGVLGAALGVVLALWCKDVLVAIIPSDMPRVEEIAIDGWVLAFALVVAMGTGLAFGLAPAFHATRMGVPASLKEGGFTAATGSRHRLRGLLVVSQVALALVLLVGGGLLMRSFARVTNVDLGFQPDRVMTFRLPLDGAAYAHGEQRAEVFRQVLERIQTLPGVKSAAASTTLPLTDSGIGLVFSVEGWEMPESFDDRVALHDSVSTDYFRTMGIPLLEGRSFTPRDRREGGGVMVINQAMTQAIRRIRPDVNPMGLRLKVSARVDDSAPEFFEIVGIVADSRRAVTDEPEPQMYVPFQQQTWEGMFFAVRTEGDPSNLISAIRGEVAAVTPDVAATSFSTFERYFDDSVADRFFAMILLGIFAGLALVLSAVGIYGMLSYSVAERVREIGLRMALGAQQADVLRFVLGRGFTLTVIGVCIGIVASLAVTRVLASFLYETSTIDPVTLVGVSLLLIAVAMLACYVPARRAAKVDPMVALRYE